MTSPEAIPFLVGLNQSRVAICVLALERKGRRFLKAVYFCISKKI